MCIMESILLLFSTNKKSRRSGDFSCPGAEPEPTWVPAPAGSEACGTPLWPRDGLQGKCFSCTCLAQGLMSIHSACVWGADGQNGEHGTHVEILSSPASDISRTLNSRMCSGHKRNFSPIQSPLQLHTPHSQSYYVAFPPGEDSRMAFRPRQSKRRFIKPKNHTADQ